MLVQAQDVDRFNNDLTLDDIHGKFHRRLPLVCDRQLYLLIDVAFQETGSISGAKTFFGKQIQGGVRDVDDLALPFHVSLDLAEIDPCDVPDLVEREWRKD